jgi:hypothetical protein
MYLLQLLDDDPKRVTETNWNQYKQVVYIGCICERLLCWRPTQNIIPRLPYGLHYPGS